MKRKKVNLSTWVSRLLILSGLFQSLIITTHINMIINLYSTIIGFFMFGFVLFTIVNILNGVNFSSKKSLITLIMTFLTSCVQVAFASLYVRETLGEIAMYNDVVMSPLVVKSLSFMGVSVGLTVIAVVLATTFFFKKQDQVALYI